MSADGGRVGGGGRPIDPGRSMGGGMGGGSDGGASMSTDGGLPAGGGGASPSQTRRSYFEGHMAPYLHSGLSVRRELVISFSH